MEVVWPRLLDGEHFDTVAATTLNHIFSCSPKIRIASITPHTIRGFECYLLVPYLHVTSCFQIVLPDHGNYYYNVPLDGPFAGMNQDLADMIVVHLTVAFFRLQIEASTPKTYSLNTLFRMFRTCSLLCDKHRDKIGHLDACRLKVHVWTSACAALEISKCTPMQEQFFYFQQQSARDDLTGFMLAYAKVVGTGLLRWKMRTMERMYACSHDADRDCILGGAGFALARDDFYARA